MGAPEQSRALYYAEQVSIEAFRRQAAAKDSAAAIRTRMRNEQFKLDELANRFASKQEQLDRQIASEIASLNKEREELLAWLEQSTSIVFKRIDT